MVSGFFLFIICCLISYLFILRRSLRIKENIKSKLQLLYETELITYLYAENEEESVNLERVGIIEKMKINSSNKFQRRIIIEIMEKLRNEISGEMSDLIKELYIKTGLINFAIGKLSHKKWYIKSIGIKELTSFQIEEVYDKVVLHINHPKKEVRNLVQLYLINLFHFKGLDFLNDLKAPLSEWDQIQLLEILQKFDDQSIPNISKWLNSSNDSTVFFALKLAKIYNQFEVIEDLIQLLSHKNIEVRIETIGLLGYFQVPEAKKHLMPTYETLSLDEQIAFFKLLEVVFDDNDEAFVIENVTNENFEIKVSAIKILKVLNVNKFMNFKQAMLNKENENIYEFIENN